MKNNIAEVWQRILSHLIDLSVMFLLPLYFLNLISNASDISAFLNRFSTGVALVVFIYPVLYSAFVSFMVSAFGGTPGKLLTGTRIVSSSGKNLSFWMAFFRNHIGYMISGVFLWLGFIWILVDKDRRSWHDQVADTFVISVSKITALFGSVFLVTLIFFEILLVTKSVANFSANVNVYTDFVNTVNESFSATPSPVPFD